MTNEQEGHSLESLGARLQSTLAELARSQGREAHYRHESDTLLRGIATLAEAKTLDEVLLGLIKVLQPFIGFEAALVVGSQPQRGTTLLCSCNEVQPYQWPWGRAFERALAGETLILYEPALLPDFAPVAHSPLWRSVLLTGLKAPGFSGVLVCRHSQQRGLDLDSKTALQRCRPLISQALVNLAYRARLEQQVELRTEALHASEQRFRHFAAMASDWFWECDERFCISYVSAPDRANGELSQRLLGRSLLTLEWLQLHDTEDFRPALCAQQPLRRLRTAVRRRGELLWLEVNADPCFSSDGAFTGYHGTARDIGDLIRREQELAKARDLAQAASQAKSRFLAMITHELRSPMNAVLGTLDLLQHAPLEEQQHALLGHATHAARMLQTVIDDVLDYSKIESGTLSLRREPFSPATLCQALLEPLYPEAQRRDLQLVLQLDSDVPETLLGDPVRLSQIIGNLLGNAMKFTPDGEVRLHLGWSSQLLIEVYDSGIGITPVDLERVFEPFVQGDSSATRSFSGAGLGLAICRRLTTLMGGEIGADSEQGKGSRFWCRLPLSLPQSPLQAPQSKPLRAPMPLSVLVVDDSEVNRMVVSLMLQRLVQEVQECASAEAALALVMSRAPDLILMDLRMPQIDGLEATRRLRGLGYTGCIVALTANAMPEDREQALAAGMDDFMAKPISLARLQECCERHFPQCAG
ncbi:ATP-binding protein [Aeromonas simiae]|uniref:ATP-binding protein n=1 Tax=Aeromonas simiae TaxID=218936 RepID=UPI00266D48D3|nr:ATP-binding protein [Aeromonas simiae]MDO2951813.1 ATP-binding protein [Aeromonas simiae]